jgi:uncharacterized protein YcbK (DUF882 family)
MEISPYFKRAEFACQCKCGFDVVDAELVQVLELLREYFNKPVVITSAARCEAHNKRVGGSERSKHRLGVAADIVVVDTPTDEVYAYLTDTYPDTYGIGHYPHFTHIDVRKQKARW